MRADDSDGSDRRVRLIVPDSRGYREDLSTRQYRDALLLCSARLEWAVEEIGRCYKLLDQIARANVYVAEEAREGAGPRVGLAKELAP